MIGPTPAAVERALLALDGLSTGDAFGERFFFPPDDLARRVAHREVPPELPWRYTNDTIMALCIVEVLKKHGRIDQSALAQAFARRYAEDPRRGYGPKAHEVLSQVDRLRELGLRVPQVTDF